MHENKHFDCVKRDIHIPIFLLKQALVKVHYRIIYEMYLFVPNKLTLATKGKARSKSAETKSKRKQQTILNARRFAQKDVGTISKRDLLC